MDLACQQLGEPAQAGQRGVQFVGDRPEEVIASFDGLLCLPVELCVIDRERRVACKVLSYLEIEVVVPP